MKIGEVCIFSEDVVKTANFYRRLLNINEDCKDSVHQFIIKDETSLTVYNDGEKHRGGSMCLAFTTENIDAEYERLLHEGFEIAEKPQLRPWGSRNMSLLDPDGNLVFLREIK